MPLWVRGEVSDFKAHRNGHWYFSPARPAVAAPLRRVVARSAAAFPPRPTTACRSPRSASSACTRRAARCSSRCSRMEADGDGLWRKALERTRARLEADGLLAPERKRALPRYPRRIAFITSASGAALRDVVAVLRRRAPGVELVVVHAAVQGETAPLELCAALDRVARWGGADARDHRPRRRLARGSVGVQRRARRARRRGVSGADDLRRRPRGRHHALRPRRRPARADAVGRRGSGGARRATRSRSRCGAQRRRLVAAIDDRLPSRAIARARRPRDMLGAATRARTSASARRRSRALAGRLQRAEPARDARARLRGRARRGRRDARRRSRSFTDGQRRSRSRLRDGEVDADDARAMRADAESER